MFHRTACNTVLAECVMHNMPPVHRRVCAAKQTKCEAIGTAWKYFDD